MGVRAAADRSPTRIQRSLVVEAGGFAILLGLLTPAPAVRIALVVAGSMLVIVAVGRFLRRPLLTWIGIALAWCARAVVAPRDDRDIAGAVRADRDGLVAVLELGTPDAVITSGRLPLPDLGSWPALGRGGPPVRVQLVIRSEPASIRALVALRVAREPMAWHDSALAAALELAVRRAGRRLDSAGIPHCRLGADDRADDLADDLAAVTDADRPLREAWDHIRGPRAWMVLRMPLGDAGMTADVLAHLIHPPSARVDVTWAGTEATIRLDAADRAALAPALAWLGTVGPVHRLDGEQRHGLRATLPLALDPVPPRFAHPLTLAPAGIRIGTDRDGHELYVRMPPGRDTPIRIVVVGGPAAAEHLTRNADLAGIAVETGGRTSGFDVAAGVRAVTGRTGDGPARLTVPLRLDVLDRPTATDAADLRDADIVVCQPMPVAAANVVSTALGLSSVTGGWLTRIDAGMVAVIADGRVRWAMISAPIMGVTARAIA